MRANFKHFRGNLGALILFSLIVFLPSKWHATCWSKSMDAIQAIHASSSSQSQRTALVDSAAPWEMLLAQEKALAKNYFGASQQASSTAQSSSVATTSESPLLHTIYRNIPTEMNSKLEVKTSKSEEKKSSVATLPVETFATQDGFLKMAKVDFDASQQLWSATWEKPQMFHFGMLLKPALVEKMTPGSSYAFQSNGQQAVVTRTTGNELVLQRGQETTHLDASGLRDLLHDKISVDGVQLFLDRRGNLVMQARGAKAISLSSNTKL